jgi:hypothetical protein
MNIKCTKCGHSEKTNLELFIKIIGGAMPVGGFYAWVAYIFAGTGLAMEICVAIIVGGVAMLVFKDQIVKFIIDKGYKCPKCGNGNWRTE